MLSGNGPGSARSTTGQVNTTPVPTSTGSPTEMLFPQLEQEPGAPFPQLPAPLSPPLGSSLALFPSAFASPSPPLPEPEPEPPPPAPPPASQVHGFMPGIGGIFGTGVVLANVAFSLQRRKTR